MGGDPQRESPFFFMKPADAIVESGSAIPYPPRTGNLHHEVELVVALMKGGRDIAVNEALDCVLGYAVGNDLTRRDLQAAAKEKGRPWDAAKGFDYSAAIGSVRSARQGHIERGRIWLKVNGELRQQGDVSEMIWKIPEIIAELSTYFELMPGDLIYTGTPAGVGPLSKGDRIEAGIDQLSVLTNTIV